MTVKGNLFEVIRRKGMVGDPGTMNCSWQR